MANNIINAVFGSGICAVTTSAFRANYGMKLRFSGIDLPTAFECDFSNYDVMGRDSITAIGQDNEVQIPDQLWDSGLNIYAYVYLHPTDDSGVTVYTVTIPVLGRPNRTEETPTPHEQTVIEQAISALNDAVEQTAADVALADASATAAAQSEANASVSERSAAASASAALASQNAAESAAQSATESASGASESARNAANSASAAAESATNAHESAEQAEQSAQSISGDVERAEQAATTATGKATEAATSATTANGAAQTATGKAAHAEQSATAAANSASAAATSASNAASSATAAANAQTAAETAQGKAEDAQAAAEAAAQSVSESAAQIAKNTDNFAPAFSASTAYAIGDYCIYQGTLYRFTNYHIAGAWIGSDAQKVSISNEITRFYMSFAKGIEKISLITGYNINTNGRYDAVQYTTYCMDQMSYFKVADGATSIGISGGKALYVRFYDEELKALGNGGRTTSANFTVQVNSADNPGLDRDAKWVKFGGQANFNGINFINLEPGRFIPVDERIDAVDERIDAVDERIDAVDNYRTITQTDMAEGYIICSAGGRAANADYVYIENVPVIPKQKVYMTAYFGGGTTNSGGISGYDENGDFKCRVFDGPINGNPDTLRTQYLNKEIIIPDGVYYIAFSTRKDGTAPIKLALGTMFDPTTIVNEAIKKHEIIDGNGTVFDAEVKASIEAVQTVLASSSVPMLTMAVFTDLHHDPKYPNDPINDMFANINAINDRIHVDALMNLGDAIDGQFQTQYQAEGCLSEVVTKMYKTTKKSHNLTGNHDDNVQSTWEDRGNLDPSERLTLLELNDVLFKGSSGEVHNPNHITDYYYDLDEYDIRVICIGLNYTSYVQATQTWLENAALNTNKKVLVFSHCATKAEWGYMNDISNGSYVETPLNNFVNNGGTVIAFIHGHTHGDMIETDSSIRFTEVAIGCAKFSVPTSGTEGITYQPRNANDETKILFDLVCVDQTNRKVHFIRFGAGTDRMISY